MTPPRLLGDRARRGERTLGSLAPAVGALALGLIALDLLSRLLPAPSPADGLVVLAGAGLLFVLAVLRAPRQPALDVDGRGDDAGSAVTENGRRRLLAGVLLVVVGAMALLSLAWFRAAETPLWL